MMENNSSLFSKPFLMVTIVAKYIHCVTRLVLNLFSVKALISSISKVQQATVREFREKPLRWRAQIFV